MGDISREPLPGGARSKGTTLKGPAEVIRLDDLTVEERTGMDETRSGTDGPEDPAARAFPSPRLAPAAPMRIEPFGPSVEPEEPAAEKQEKQEQPGADLPESAGSGVASEHVEVAAEDETAAEDQAAFGDDPAVEDHSALEDRAVSLESADEDVLPADEGSDAATVDAELVDATDEVGPTAVDEDLEACAVPSVDELVADGDAVPALAEPLRASSLPADSDEAPPLTDPEEVGRVLLAVLLSAREPLSMVRMAEVCNSTQKVVEAGLRALDTELRQRGLPLEIVQMGDGVRVSTSPTVYPYLTRLKKLKPAEKLSPAALETLAVIAYRQPVIRLEVEAIRGVKVGPMLQSLLQHKLIRVVGRADVPGKPLQYGTTQHFLERFGLRSLKDLPSIQEFRALG